MEFSNDKSVRRLRLGFLILGISWLLTIAFLILLEMFGTSVIMAGLFLVAVFTVALLNFQYIRISVEKNRMIVRYYSLFSVDRLFQMFEFPVEQLRGIETRKYFFGLKQELRLTVRVRKGLADYPWVSLSAVPIRERTQLILELKKLARQL
jgi:hypothetical protein